VAEPVTPDQILEPRTGLFASAIRPEGPTRNADGRTVPSWPLGITYTREGCIGLSGLTNPCETLDLEDPEPETLVKWMPYGVWAGAICPVAGSPPNSLLDDLSQKAQRRLLASSQKQVERELWSGILAQENAGDPNWENLWLTNGDATDLGTAESLLDGLACLVKYLGDTAEGTRGMIHMTTQVASLLTATNALYRSGNLLLTTATDDIVVAGRGYALDAEGEVDPETYDLMFATDIVDVRLETPTVTGDSLSEVQFLKNRAIVRAHRLALASWDGCRFAQIQIDNLPACAAVS
jgi:hypothetical protein